MKALVFALSACVLGAQGPNDGLATDKDFKIVTDGSTQKLKSGDTGNFVLSVVALNGFKVSQETPFTVKLSPSGGLKVAADKFARKDLVDPKAKDPQLKTTFTAQAHGAHGIKADVVFFLCTEKLCQRMSASSDLKVTVE